MDKTEMTHNFEENHFCILFSINTEPTTLIWLMFHIIWFYIIIIQCQVIKVVYMHTNNVENPTHDGRYPNIDQSRTGRINLAQFNCFNFLIQYYVMIKIKCLPRLQYDSFEIFIAVLKLFIIQDI